ncbi:hypothetical protein [Ferrimonas balearica]|uniref:hypothetical protein n=1 Tax=Ferrimonas balearica TaxID=44012 RepID=UPI001F23B4EC|nr:hypothetical protein [Ferrimonas balearica]MBY6018876.1 hypothetical protein [Halomonas denitrificans]MBY6096066.1 hypothetical protein [Ferrimonas balearica]
MSHDPIESLAQNLSDELPPQRDLWPGIERGLDRPRSEPKPTWQRVAGWLTPLLLGTLLGLGGGYWVGNKPGQDPQAMVAMLEVMARQHEARLANARQPFFQVGEQEGKSSEGEQTLKQASQELLQALRQDPFNPALLELWLWVQQKELDLIEQQQQQHRRLQQL